MDFRILGPLEVGQGPDRLDLGGPRQQTVLAMLLVNAGNVVSVGRLQEAIYGENLPPTSRSQVQISISSLRRLFASHGRDGSISTWGQGYVFHVGIGTIDWWRFEELTATARAARDAGHLDRAVAGYRDALRLWRGAAFEGIESQLVQAAAARLDGQRMAINEDRLALELDLGRHHELVGELTGLAEEFPLRERLREQLMLALYRCGRTAEALQAYRHARQTMVDELGIEPCESLQRLEYAILNSDPALDAPNAPFQPQHSPVPGLLPADIADFTGRAEQVDLVYQHLIRPAGQDPRPALPVVVIGGRGGIGKTTMAVHASHGMAGHFADGQLFADLHGDTAHPVSPSQVLGRFLRALGVPGAQIPDGLDERAEMYRNLLADRSILVVLDDADDEGQVSPLLPGHGAAAVIVTSRHSLAGLAGASHIDIGVLDPGSSLDLLARIAGSARVQRESGAAAAVAEWCGHLPLALRIAGARLAARPHWSVEQLAERLADETRRLDELRHGDLGVRANISLTYDGASDQARRLVRLLALLDQPVFSGWVSAALLDQPPNLAADLLDDLVSLHLIEASGTGSGVHCQYRFHELIRTFARERLAAEETPEERAAALERALGALLYLASEADRLHLGGMDYFRERSEALQWRLPSQLVEELVSEPVAWYERERAALVSGVRQAAQAGLSELCWRLAACEISLFSARAYFDDWQETPDTALEAARQAQDVRGHAAMVYALGNLNLAWMRVELARLDSDAAALMSQNARDDCGPAVATDQPESLDQLGGRLDDATRHYERALATFNAIGDGLEAAYVLYNLAQVKMELGEHGPATELLSEALQRVQSCRSARAESMVLCRMGEAYLGAGDLARAVEAFEFALTKVRDLADLIGESYVLSGLGIAKTRQGEFDQARTALQRVLELAGTAQERLARARALLGLSELALSTKDPGQAASLAQQASDAFQELGAPLLEARALTLLSQAYCALNDGASAAAAAMRADTLRARRATSTPIV